MAKRGRPRTLSEEQIVQAILEQGIGIFSLPAIARRLGVAHPALYRYFATRDEMAQAAMSSAALSARWPAAELPWDELLPAIGDSVWTICETYPGFDRAVLDQQWPEPTHHLFARYIPRLGTQGFTQDDAVIAIDLVRSIAVTSRVKPPTALIGARPRYEHQLDLALAGIGNVIRPGGQSAGTV